MRRRTHLVLAKTVSVKIGMNTIGSVLNPAAVLIAAIGMAASASHAQNALGDGTGLANPLDVYQRQFNSESRTDQFRREIQFQNAIVTGRAAGGLSFRGDAGYGSALEFRGELGSDVTYAFRRDSAISGLAAQGVSGTDALRFQFALSTGSAAPSGYTGSGIVARNPSHIVLSASAFPARAMGDSAEPFRSIPLGERTYQELAAAGETLRAEARDLRSVSGLVGQRSLNPATVQTVDLGLGRQSYDVVASPAAGVRMRPIDSPLVLGGMRPDSTALRTAETSPGMLSAINRQIVRRPVDPLRPVPGVDAPAPTDPLANDPADVPTGDVPAANDPLNPAIPGVPNPTTSDPLDPLDTGASPVADPADVAGAGLLTLGRLSTIREMLSIDGGAAFEQDDAFLSDYEIELLRGVPRVDALVERKAGIEVDAAYVLHMARAQSLLTEGRYFDAEERFVTALSIRPNDPTAMIGRVHAQMGGGLLRSGSSNLRETFTRFPELVGVRYAENLLPSSERLELLLKELGFAADLPQASIGLMRAYVGFQSDNRQLVLDGLEQLRSGSRSELALAKLLGQVWLADDKP